MPIFKELPYRQEKMIVAKTCPHDMIALLTMKFFYFEATLPKQGLVQIKGNILRVKR